MAPSNFREGRKALTVFLLDGLIGVSFRLHGGPMKVSFLLISLCLSPAVGNQLRISCWESHCGGLSGDLTGDGNSDNC